jgi:hypothetical protein
MTDNNNDSRSDEQSINPNSVSRRTYLQSIATAPVTLALPDSRESSTTSQLSLVTAEALPDAFTSIELDSPPRFGRQLMERDGRFSADQFAVRGFGEVPDGENPRYIVSMGSVELPEPDAASTVRDLAAEIFGDYMDRLYDIVGVEWAQVDTSGYEDAAVHRQAEIRYDEFATAQVKWIDPSPSAQCAEHWVLDTTDQQAVLTVVFGSRQGPWYPQTLLDWARADMMRRGDR